MREAGDVSRPVGTQAEAGGRERLGLGGEFMLARAVLRLLERFERAG